MGQKTIYSQFNGGIGDSDRNLPNNQYYSGVDVDLYLNYGYLSSGVEGTDITLTNLISPIIEIINSPSSNYTFILSKYDIISGYGRIFCINGSDTDVGNIFGGGSLNYVTLQGLVQARGITLKCAGDLGYSTLFVYNGTVNDIAKSSVTDDWSTSLVPTFHHTQTSSYLNAGNRDIILWKGFIFYTNGQNVGIGDPTQNPIAFNDTFIDLGSTWTSDVFFTTSNYLGICAHNTANIYSSKICLFDIAGNLIEQINIDGLSITAATNNSGTIIIFATDGIESAMFSLQDEGINKIKVLQYDNAGVPSGLPSPNVNMISNLRNDTLFSSNQFILRYGNRSINENLALSFPMSCPYTIYSLRKVGQLKYYAGYSDGVNFKLRLLASYIFYSYSSNAVCKFGYTDLGQKIRINYIKFYYRPLANNGSRLTPTIDLDYGDRSISLVDKRGNTDISYANDFRQTNYDINQSNTSKRFDVKIDCHSFRPVLSWNVWTVLISKIEIDWDYLSEDN